MEQNLGFKQQLSQQQKLSYQMIQSISLLNDTIDKSFVYSNDRTFRKDL